MHLGCVYRTITIMNAFKVCVQYGTSLMHLGCVYRTITIMNAFRVCVQYGTLLMHLGCLYRILPGAFPYIYLVIQGGHVQFQPPQPTY